VIQVLAIALGGAVGAALRYVLASSVSLWLGQSFPYGTLAVNILGSFLIGLMSEALLLERAGLAVAFRAGILVGVFGSLTTFSTFAFETLYLWQQGEWASALLNLALNAGLCLAAVLAGLLCGRSLFYYGRGMASVQGLPVPYAFSAVNFLGAVLVGVVLALLEPWLGSQSAHVAVSLLLAGAYIISSAIYLTLFLAEASADFKHHGRLALVLVVLNTLLCAVGIWLGASLR
jgi:CrcB protein